MTKASLTLHEEVLLLALRDEKGTVESGAHYQYALAGSIVAELLVLGRIGLEGEGRKRKVVVLNDEPTGNPVMDEALAKIGVAKRSANLQTWVGKLAGTRELKHKVAAELCRKGILKAEEDKILLLFKRRIYPEIDPEPEMALVGRLQRAIFTDEEVDAPTAVLLSLAKAANILPAKFDRKELKQRKERIEKVVNGEMSGKATKQAIEAMQAAVMVSTIIPTIIVTTS